MIEYVVSVVQAVSLTLFGGIIMLMGGGMLIPLGLSAKEKARDMGREYKIKAKSATRGFRFDDPLTHDELDAQFRELEAQVARRELSRRRVEVRKSCTVDHSIDGMSSERWSIDAILVDGRPATREEWATAETMIERGEL